MTSTVTKNDISIDEVVSLLKKTSLPTIVVEGKDDMIVYRTFEQRLQHLTVSILPVGGREKVLKVFKRRAEFSKNAKVAFVADQDIWVNCGIPTDFQEECLVLTTGYSVENDVIADGELWTLLRPAEVTRFQAELNQFVNWYALALARHLADQSQPISFHPEYVLDPQHHTGLLTLRAGETYPTEIQATLLENYTRLLRGKSLLALLLRCLSYKGREPKHSGDALLEWVATKPGENLNRMISELSHHFS